MKVGILSICIYVLVLGVTPTYSLVIKLGTVAPEGSPWHDAMLETAQRWKELSGGRVTVRIYAGGVAGDEKDMLRKIRIGQLHATALTSSTLIDIIPDIEAISFHIGGIRTPEEKLPLFHIGGRNDRFLCKKVGPTRHAPGKNLKALLGQAGFEFRAQLFYDIVKFSIGADQHGQ